ncbi:N-acetylmuramoyl-L-alanine amidase [Parasutterella secunda]|uniref:N-acetylmuramoyl-L-alanine amidase n=1 Tax=Parasutterella secunda TaxID=626947 RepID=UPI0021AC9A4D|nr:N-acetylmuramoyl-L-alanine amidase [Parasutterella secunda]MCR8920459.1 N-acetylmuramoyl-L-alanine amidase [Parasutterella secunda]
MDISRRTLIGTTTGTLALTLLPVRVAHAAQMVDVRMWPAEEYTRVTLEHDEPIKFKYFLVRSPMPYRLVVDIEGLKLTAKLQKMISDVSPKDPYIQAVRIGQFTPTVVRLVMDLKSEVRPEVFSLKPVANYKYRLIFDIYPVQSEDPIAGVIAGLNNKNQQKDPLGDLIAQNRQPAKQNENTKETKAQPQKPAQTAKNTNVEKNKAQASTSKSKTAAETKKQTQPKTVAPKKRDIVIVVDAGHGGEDPGAVGKRKTYEKHITLSIAKRLERLIKREKGMKVVMTRSSDHFVSLSQRVMIAQKAKAHLFVSIHADAWTKPSAKGSSVYALAERGATSSAARWLAKNQNDADLIGGANFKEVDRRLQSVLVDMTTSWKINYSLELGHSVLQYLGRINTLHRRQVEQAGFLVLKAPGIPSILVETAFISNPQEERKLKTAAYQQKVADAILKGIKAQVKKNDSIMQS